MTGTPDMMVKTLIHKPTHLMAGFDNIKGYIIPLLGLDGAVVGTCPVTSLLVYVFRCNWLCPL